MKNILTVKILLGMLGFAAALLLLTIVLMLARSGTDDGTPPAALTVIAAPSSTPPGQGATPTLPPDQQATPTLLPGQFGIGVYVQISGTQGDGLRLRADPGLNAEPLFLGADSEVFHVVDGPVSADGYTWWKLTAPYDTARTGWAVQDYLAIIQSP
jgi:hypothetical protein